MSQICKHGHDISVVGRNARRVCREWKSQNIINVDGTVFTLKDYDRLYKSQNGCCAICGVSQSKFCEQLVVDHDHKTGKVRQLLCRKHNSAIGLFGDDIVQVLEAVKYLKRHRKVRL
jgi:hypothetical protein